MDFVSLRDVFKELCIIDEPILWQREHRDVMDHIVGEILIQVGERVGISAQHLILVPESIPCRQLSETHKINDI